MTISLIAAISRNGVIGKGDGLPWYLPADLRHFKELTLRKPVIMGRKTFETMGKPLEKRRNIILTRDKDYKIEGAEVVHSLQEALRLSSGEPEVMVAGGATVYEQVLPYADRMYLTFIHQDFEGDTRFPEYDEKVWIEREREDHSANEHPYAFSFVLLEREDGPEETFH